MADWGGTVRRGNYAVEGCVLDYESELARYEGAVLAVNMQDDELVPEVTLDLLLDRFKSTNPKRVFLDEADFDGHKARHFSTLKNPKPTARVIADGMLGSA